MTRTKIPIWKMTFRCRSGYEAGEKMKDKGYWITIVPADDAGQIMMKWDNGRSLSLIPGVDSFHTVTQTEDMTEDMDEGQDMSM